MVKLGDLVQDSITGFKGVATGEAIYLTGCRQIHIQPECDRDTGKFPEGTWLDEPRLRVLQKKHRSIKLEEEVGCDTTRQKEIK